MWREPAGGESWRPAVTTSLWQPCRWVRVVAATMSLGGSPEAGQVVIKEADGAGVPGEDLTLTPEETHPVSDLFCYPEPALVVTKIR